MKWIVSFLLRYIPRPVLQHISHVGLQVAAWFYAGNSVEDPINGRTYRSFLPYGRLHPRPNALSPHSLSLERHRLIWLYLQRKTTFFKGNLRMLHIAPELCFMKPFESLLGEGYITADIESPLAKVKMDIHRIPFDDNSFDVIFCNHVLEHVDDDLQAMREMKRVLKPSGWAILQVPLEHDRNATYEDKTIVDPKQRELHFGQNDHQRVYGIDYGRRLQKAGFTVHEDRLVQELTPEEVKRYGLDPKEILYVVSKGSDALA